MKFKQVMGIIYLTLFIGAMGYKLWDTMSHREDGILIMLLVVAVVLMIVMLVRKVIYH